MKTRLRTLRKEPARFSCESGLLARARKGPVFVELGKFQLGLKTILVPTDFSETSVKALRYAVPFAEQYGATIELAHVVEPVSFINDLENIPLAVRDGSQVDNARRRLLELAQKEVEELEPVKAHVGRGRPWEEIVKLAER